MSAVYSVEAQKRMCEGKRVHFSRTAAIVAANGRMQRVGRGLVLRAYRCPNCGFWHLTSKPKNESTNRVRPGGNAAPDGASNRS